MAWEDRKKSKCFTQMDVVSQDIAEASPVAITFGFTWKEIHSRVNFGVI